MSLDPDGSPSGPLSPISISYPSLVKQRQEFVQAQKGYRTTHPHRETPATTAASSDPRRRTISAAVGFLSDDDESGGNWVTHSNVALAGVSAPSIGVGLPNFVPYGHPSLRDETPARLTHGNPNVSAIIASRTEEEDQDDGGLEGRPFVSQAEKNVRAAKVVSQASAMLREMQRDKSYDPIVSPTPTADAGRLPFHRSIQSTDLRSGGGVGGKAVGSGLTAGGKLPISTRAHMPHFAVEHYMRSNHRMLSQADRLTATEVLRIEPFDRDPAHLSTLSKFLASIDFFAGLSDTLRADIAAIATLRVLRKEEPVYSEGEEAHHIYVILSGSVGTRVKDYMGTLAGSAASGGGGGRSSLFTTPGFVAATIGTGECFGQESMGTEERTLQRTQTKIALERTELLQLDMKDYKAILRISLSKESAAKMDFVALLPIFEMCTMRELHRIAMALQIVHYPKNHVILKQGEQSDKVYFIQSGECRVVHKVYTKVVSREQPLLRLNSPIQQTPQERMQRKQRRSDSMGAQMNRAGGMSILTGYGLHQPREPNEEQKQQGSPTAAAASGSGSSPVASVPHDRKGGGGAYQFERARAFEASRAASRQQQGGGGDADGRRGRSTAPGGGASTAPSRSKRPEWGGGSGTSPDRASGHVARPSAVEQAAAYAHALKQSQQGPTVVRTVLQPQLLDLGRLSAKWFFGEYGVLTDAPRSASVYAETNVTLMVLTKEDFFTRLPPFCLKFIRDYIDAFYAPESVMREQFHSQQRWEAFKGKMLQTNGRTKYAAEVTRQFAGTLNGLKHTTPAMQP